jgi:hypothetical protein
VFVCHDIIELIRHSCSHRTFAIVHIVQYHTVLYGTVALRRKKSTCEQPLEPNTLSKGLCGRLVMESGMSTIPLQSGK